MLAVSESLVQPRPTRPGVAAEDGRRGGSALCPARLDHAVLAAASLKRWSYDARCSPFDSQATHHKWGEPLRMAERVRQLGAGLLKCSQHQSSGRCRTSSCQPTSPDIWDTRNGEIWPRPRHMICPICLDFTRQEHRRTSCHTVISLTLRDFRPHMQPPVGPV